MPLLPFDEARALIAARIGEGQVPPLRETLPLDAVLGRVLAANVAADRDYPSFNRSARDGYAVLAADVARTPAKLHVIGETRAGEASRFRLEPGQAVRIMTGAPGPEGADAVVMQEYSQLDGDQVTLEQGVPSGKNLIPRGSEARAGAVVLEAGATLGYAEIALLGSLGVAEAQVYRRPEVAILSTGDEVLPIDSVPEPYQIRNSNAYSLAAQVQRAGGEPCILPIAPDQPDRTRELIEEGLKSDLLLLSGGASVGKYDYVARVLRELDAEIFITNVAIQPGKPLVFAKVGGKPVFGLPGNPISTMITFEVFARIALDLLAGRSSSRLPFLRGRLAKDFSHKPVLTRFLPAVLRGDYGDVTVDPVQWQGSGDLVGLARADCFLVATPDRDFWKAGDWISVLPR
ncbi:MAG: molybdopterin molybdotransferase MoeA [Acidobacteria bacterium]|nr:molybdopterin molybdotransferase MoeA [Acidobacteriota bacterium]